MFTSIYPKQGGFRDDLRDPGKRRDTDGALHGKFPVSFQRALRIPDEGKVYPLPPGFGRFPIHRVEDYAERVPEPGREHGGYNSSFSLDLISRNSPKAPNVRFPSSSRS